MLKKRNDFIWPTFGLAPLPGEIARNREIAKSNWNRKSNWGKKCIRRHLVYADVQLEANGLSASVAVGQEIGLLSADSYAPPSAFLAHALYRPLPFCFCLAAG